MKRSLIIVLLAALAAGTIVWLQHTPAADKPSSPAAASGAATQVVASPPSLNLPKTNAVGGSSLPSPVAVASTSQPQSREFDLTVNPYAAALRAPGKSKRAWDADYIKKFQTAKAGDPVQFELTGGVLAEGSVKIIQAEGGQVSYVSGILTAPEPGKFFFLTPPAGGKAGSAVGVVEFPASKTAYRIEPTGPGGAPELYQRHLDEVICMDMPAVDPAKLQAAQAAEQATTNLTENLVPLRSDLEPNYMPSYNSNIVSLQSYPGSPAVLLLDFFGGTTIYWGGVTYARPPVDSGVIKGVWEQVAENYMPFNINVTTDMKVYEAAAPGSRMRCCYTTTPVTAAGVAYEGSWNWGGDIMCWSVYIAGKNAAEVGSHEPGHTLGLSHETQEIPDGSGGFTHNEYYAGQGSGATGWAPIMGVGYYQEVSQWSKGEFQYAGNLQDQLAIIATANNGVTYRTDDTGDTLATSRYLEIYTNNTAFAEGVIERTDDTDAFQFATTGGTVSLTASPLGWGKLAIMASLADATDTIIASNSPQNVLSASITTNLPAGIYTFRVTGAGRNDPLDTGFSSYASLGYYSITGSVAGARMPTRLTVAEHATNNTVVGPVPAINPNSSPLMYAITAGNTDATFSVDNNGVVNVANNALLDYYKLATNWNSYAAQFEVFMNITNLNNPALTELNRRVVIAVQQLYPPTPVYLSAVVDSNLRIDLAWAGGQGLAALSYNVKRSTTPGGPYTTVGTSSTTSYIDTGMTEGLIYYYVVSAVNANGESANSAEASASAQPIANFGFEAPFIGSANFVFNPSGAGWIFSGANPDGSAIVANGSPYGSPNAPEGVQAAFIQGHGTITQTLSGFAPGTTYQVRYLAAQRGGFSETWNVKIDNTVIQTNAAGSTSYTPYIATFTATAGIHTLSFVGTDLAGNADTVFIDNVQVSIVTPTILNFSFETPGVGTGTGGFQYNPAGGSWAFSGGNPYGSGILGNGSAFSNPNAPVGAQAAFIQTFSTISQTISGFIPGQTYTLGYLAAQRPGYSESWNVKIDGTVIQSNTPGSTSYTPYTANFVASSTSHTLTFVGTDLAGNNDTVFIDNVSLSSTIQPNHAATVTLTSPANNAVFGVLAPVSLTASVTTNGNLINSVQFYADGTLLGQFANAPYTCAWANATGGSHSMFARVIFNNGSSSDSAPITLTVINQDTNLGFETPVYWTGFYGYSLSGAAWTFSGFTGDGSGIMANGGGYSNPNAPEGTQAGFLNAYGTIKQTLTGFVPGTNYTITYSAAQRLAPYQQNGGESWNVAIDGNVIASNAPGSTSYTTYTANFTATATNHTLAFIGTDLTGGDNMVYIDNVSFNPPLVIVPIPYLLTNTLPATAADVVGSQVKFVAGFSSASPVTYQWQKIANGLLSNIAGATNTVLTLTNLQLSDAATYRLQASNTFGIAVSTASPLAVSSVPAASNNIVTSYAAQTGLGSASPTFAPTWTVAAGSLIAGQSPSSVGPGNFTQSVGLLTDGTLGTLPNGGVSSTVVTCGGGAGQSVTYALNGSTNGYNLTNIVVYGGWGNAGRDQQAYTVYYATVGNPANFILLSSVNFDPVNPASVQSATRATLVPVSGVLASNVAALMFDFTTPAPENSYVGYSEIQVFGSVSPPSPVPLVLTNTLPATAADVVGSQVTFTAAFSSANPITYQWVKITNGVPVNIAGATNTTLTLNNLQPSDTASYQLQASNVYGSSGSTASSLTVSSVPAAVTNVIIACAAQTGLGSAVPIFTPTWTVAAGSLLAGQSPSSVGGGNFSADGPGTVAVLTDGGAGSSSYASGTASASQVTGGGSYGRGQSVTYTLGGSTNGYTLANVVVYGGWCDGGRDQQAYTVYYSTVAAPTNFILLSSVSYNPVNPSGIQSANRVTLLPASGALATNVGMVKFDFTTPVGKNGYEGYSEIQLFGSAAPAPIAPVLFTDINPTSASDVVGGQEIFTAAFNGFTQPLFYQWLVNTGSGSVPIPGATNTTLTLGNLQLANAGAYSLQASNAAGVAVSASATLVVNPAPLPDANGIVVSPASQLGTVGTLPFTPSWNFNTNNDLLLGLTPTSGTGNFGQFTAASSNNLTRASTPLSVVDYTTSAGTNVCMAGNSAGGQTLIYTLPTTTYGQNITNITVYGAWQDNGRDAQNYTISYTTLGQPGTYIPVTSVSYVPLNASGNPDATRVVINAAVGAAILRNAVTLKFDFTTPTSAQENGAAGYTVITAQGTAATGAFLTYSNKVLASGGAPGYVIETNSLIHGMAPSSVGSGNFANFGIGCPGTSALTDGAYTYVGDATSSGGISYATCGSSSGTSVTYTLTNSVNGSDLTNIVVYSGWTDARDGQFYIVSYSTVAAPTTFIPITQVYYNPPGSGWFANRVGISDPTGAPLAKNVLKLKFDFSVQTAGIDNGASLYAEIIVQGKNTVVASGPININPVRVSGGSLILTGTGGTPGGTYSWLTATNVATPLAQWTTNSVGAFDGVGAFSNAIPISPSQAANYFRVRVP